MTIFIKFTDSTGEVFYINPDKIDFIGPSLSDDPKIKSNLWIKDTCFTFTETPDELISMWEK